MLQKKVKKRASLLTLFLLVSVLAIFLILKSLNKNILYFKSPTDIYIIQDLDFNKKIDKHNTNEKFQFIQTSNAVDGNSSDSIMCAR